MWGSKEALFICEFMHHFGHGPLKRWSRSHVDDSPAWWTEKMMMVMEEVLRQLKASKFIDCGDSSDHPSLLKIGEMTIGRTPWNFGNLRFNLWDADGAAKWGQELNHRSPTRRVTLIDSPQEYLNKAVKIFDRLKGLQLRDSSHSGLVWEIERLPPTQ
jgi:hypothetical protein